MTARTHLVRYRLSLFLAALGWTCFGHGLAYGQEPSAPQATAATTQGHNQRDNARGNAEKPAKPAEKPAQAAEGPNGVKTLDSPQHAKPADAARRKDATQGKAGAKGPEAAKAAGRAKPATSKPTQAETQADNPKPEPSVADAAKDPDFALQGEFVGPVAIGPAKYQPVALQVKPTGTGSFEAMQYTGGLPGEPAHRPVPIMLIGKRSEDFLVLSGGPWAVFVESDQCLLVDRQGQRVGRLERVARQSPTLGAVPPKEAIVLFDGKDTGQFIKASMTEDGLLKEGAYIKAMLQDFNLHLEFMLPYVPAAKDQGRGNSGVYLQSRYEVQILDSFAEEPRFNGGGSLYRFHAPEVNMCLPPLVWQTYDIMFTAPRWAADKTKLSNARVTLWHNGVKVQNHLELEDKTGHGEAEEPTLLPTYLQDHKNPVRFRNVWIVDRGASTAAAFPLFTMPAGQETKAAGPQRNQQKKPAAPHASRPGGKKADTVDGKATEAKPKPAEADVVPAVAAPANTQPKSADGNATKP